MQFLLRTLAASVAVAACSMGSLARADTITFNEFTWQAPAVAPVLGGAFISGGYEFTATFALVGNPPADFRVRESDHPWQADPGFAAIEMTDYPTNVRFSKLGGAAFDLLSIDLADSGNGGVDRKLRFTFEYALGGSSTLDVTLDTLVGLQTLVLNEMQLSSVTMRGMERFVGDFPWYQFDNLVVATSVPEPSAHSLLALGLAAVGLATRRRPRGA